jgi:uncharacterized protein
MKHLLLLAIRFYWLIPSKYRKRCVFKVSCSCHVYDTCKADGFRKALTELRYRIKTCRPGYILYDFEERQWVILQNGDVIDRKQTNV